MVPRSSRLILSVQILDDLKDVSRSVSLFGLESLQKFNVRVIIDGRLGVRFNEVYLYGVPLFDGGHS